MADHKLEIRVQNDRTKPAHGSLAYTWSALHAAPGDTITWFSRQGSFKVVFQERSPFVGNKHGISSYAEGEAFMTKPLAIATGAEVLGTYYYSVAVAVGKEIFLDAACPSVIIE